MIRSLEVKAAHGLVLLFQPVGWENELHALPGALGRVCHFTAAALPGFSLALCAKAIYVDLCKFCAKMNYFQSKWVFFKWLEKLICGIDGRKSTSSAMGRWEQFTEMPLNHELFVSYPSLYVVVGFL